VRFDDWEPLYEGILDDLGYSRERDREVARLLDGYIDGFEEERLLETVGGEGVVVVGDAPSLDPADVDAKRAVIAADGAAERLAGAGIDPDVVVTDLDGAPGFAAEASHRGTVVAVHAHGDNADGVERWLPEFDTRNVIGTTQARPVGSLYNFGGLTDGDRAAFLADVFGAASISLAGFDFEDAEGEKLRKLAWAERLLRRLGDQRDETLIG